MRDVQLEFPFLKEIKQINGEICMKCKNRDRATSTCYLTREEIDPIGTCSEFDWTQDQKMDDIAAENKQDFYEIIQKYKISEEDADSLYQSAQLF
jgi:hypothetical protein